MYVRMYVRMCVYVYMYVYVCMRVCVCKCRPECMLIFCQRTFYVRAFNGEPQHKFYFKIEAYSFNLNFYKVA